MRLSLLCLIDTTLPPLIFQGPRHHDQSLLRSKLRPMTAFASSNVPISGSERYLAVMLNGGWLTKWSDHPSKRCAATINVLHRAMKIPEVQAPRSS